MISCSSSPSCGLYAAIAASLAIALAAGEARGAAAGAFVAPAIPAARSALVPPELTAACPITASGIDALVVKGRGLAFNGASFGSVGTYTYILAEATAHASATDACAATIVDLKNAADVSGQVGYSFDVVILTPTDAAQASGTCSTRSATAPRRCRSRCSTMAASTTCTTRPAR